MPKPLRVAGEVDSWCTRCRLILNHRIVSMKDGKAYRVECLTCRSQHLWRAGVPGEAPSSGSGGERVRTPSAQGSSRQARGSAQRHEQQWEKAIAGHGVHEFKAYDVAAHFKEGDLVRHKKFGEGLVTRVIDSHKVEVLFRDEARTLAQAMG
ncbi:MAG TPA: hypothetical protein VEK07_05835 [Polyangiaceae bacterium]|nr:hypothetical protein [Polyangiaceae bacterium]